MSDTPKKRQLDGSASAAPESRAPERSPGEGYDVGYGKPPKQTRFAKGQSGNPRGRPRKPKPEPLRLSDAPSDGFLEQEITT